jgi:hypothetical protein
MRIWSWLNDSAMINQKTSTDGLHRVVVSPQQEAAASPPGYGQADSTEMSVCRIEASILLDLVDNVAHAKRLGTPCI